MNLNATNIMDYLTCPARFFYRSILKVTTDLVESDELIFGRDMHDILELYPNVWQSIEEATKKFAYKFDDVDKFYNQLSIFKEKFSWLLDKDDLKEYSFTLETDYEDLYITGRFDRITKNGTIIDWKTGNVKRDLSFNIQAVIYNYAYKKIFDKEPKDVLFCSLKTGSISSYTPSKDTSVIEKVLFDKIIPKIYGETVFIESGLFNGSCDYCMYKSVCHKELGINEKDNKKDFNELFAY